MFFPLLYYAVIPLLAAWLVVKFIRGYGGSGVPADVAALYERLPMEKRWHRAVRRDGAGLAALGDFEKREEAVEEIYRGRDAARAAGQKASFIVLNDKGEALEQVDS